MDFLSQSPALAGTLPHKAVDAFVQREPVVAQVLHPDHAFHRYIGQLYKQAEAGHAGYDTCKTLSFPSAQGKAAKAAAHFSFRFYSGAFPSVKLICQAQQLLTSRQWPGLQPQRCLECPMHQKVCVSPDG